MSRDQIKSYSAHQGDLPDDQGQGGSAEASPLLTQGPQPPLLFTIAEASATLRISKWMLYHLIHTRQLDTVKIGRRRFVPAPSLRAFIDQLRNSGGA